MVLNNADNEAIYLLDTKTGKKEFSEADLVKKFPELKDYLKSLISLIIVLWIIAISIFMD